MTLWQMRGKKYNPFICVPPIAAEPHTDKRVMSKVYHIFEICQTTKTLRNNSKFTISARKLGQ